MFVKLPVASALLLVGMAFTTSHALSQCSDAGVCVIGSRRPPLRHEIGLNFIYGKGKPDDGLSFKTIQLDAMLHAAPDSRILFLFPWTIVDGPLGSVNGAGDLSVVWSQTVFTNERGIVTLQFGAKLATGTSNSGNLPQAYQPGLGTNDWFFGALYDIEAWAFGLGYQFSRGRSNNAQTRLQRGDDILLRAGYRQDLEDFTVSAEFLAIHRLNSSSVVVPGTEMFAEVPESDQSQVNFLGKITYPAGTYSIHGMFAIPFLNRKVNVDGLTRVFTVSLGIQREF